MILSADIITIGVVDSIIVVLSTLAFFISLEIVVFWDSNSREGLQYRLQKRNYLAATIIKFILYLKIPFFLFFIYTLDNLSNILPGAMCGAGVVNSSSVGTPLLMLKILNIYLFAFWLALHQVDMKSMEQKYLKMKFVFFLVIYLLMMVEIFMEFRFFQALDINKVVDCCGVIFSHTDGSYISRVMNLSHSVILGWVYGVFSVMIGSYFFKNFTLFSFLNLLFLVIALLSLIAYFGTYIYELPTHHCPFCLLQKEYHFVGYFLYIFLFLGTLYGMLAGLLPTQETQLQTNMKLSLFFNALYLVLVSYYPISYYLAHGTWL